MPDHDHDRGHDGDVAGDGDGGVGREHHVGEAAGRDLTLHEAAELLGVHYMTVYRYVRLGLLPAAKSGGTWRVRRADVASVGTGRRGSSSSASSASSASSRPTGPVRAGSPAPWAERLESRLLAGDSRGAWGVVEAALAAGAELDEIYLDVLSPALVGIGNRWERGEIDVAIEHRATGIAMRLIGRLGPRFVRRGRTRGAVVVGAPEGERHGIPVAMLADLLRAAGWDVSDLGADTPAASFAHAVAATDDVVAAGLSVIDHDHLPACAAACAAIRAAAPRVLVVVGGQAVESPAAARELGADRYAGSAAEMIAVLDGLGPVSER